MNCCPAWFPYGSCPGESNERYVMRRLGVVLIAIGIIGVNACRQPAQESPFSDGQMISIEKSVLLDKVKGGWAGQVIGCTYGGPTEFRWQGTMIDDRVPIVWDEHQMQHWYDTAPGLYDDIYMDLTFVAVFEEHGLDAADNLHALAFANAEYPLWHANQAARYNILNGIMPPDSGYWKNNPHADDIDFQIEADFAGLMSPGMINASSAISDRIGHIMNYGDGWYGGVFVAGMYTQAFVSDDMNFIVREALQAVPEESRFHQTIADVIRWHEMYPDDWKRNWFEIQKKWSFDKGCPDGVFRPFNIDASLNAAYIVLGLLYGGGDFGQTVDISTRAGQDSDCNPSNAAGILGTMVGYSNIPDHWKQGLDKVEDRKFVYTDMSLQDVYGIGFRHALQMIERHGGKVLDDVVEIRYQKVEPVRLEQSFEGLFPRERITSGKRLTGEDPEFSASFTGAGFVIEGSASKTGGNLPDRDLKVDVYVNGELVETSVMPTEFRRRKPEVYWNYELPEGDHEVKVVTNDIPPGYRVNVNAILVYSSNDPGPRSY
jgi:hypothetical protein